jgi:universal stress protein E
MFRKILVYINGLAENHPALERAMQLAVSNNALLKIVDVVNTKIDPKHEFHRPMRTLIEQRRKDRLDKICELLAKQDIEYSTKLLRGRPFAEIVQEVVNERFDLVIKTMGGHQPSKVKGMMSPLDMRLVRNCPSPIWLEAPGNNLRLERIVVAIDPEIENDEFNDSLLDISTSLASVENGELHVVSAWNVPDEEFLTEHVTPKQLTDYADKIQAESNRCLKRILNRADKSGGPSNVHFRRSAPSRAILDYVDKHQPDVTVIGTLGCTSVAGLLIGDTADFVLRHINCSVVAVKPTTLFHA